MRDITIKEIIDLATQDIPDPESELKKIYDWHHERKVMIIKGTIGIAISLIITLSVAYYKNEIKVNEWNMLYPLILATLSMTYGVFELSRVKKVGKKYVAAIILLGRFKKIKPFLTIYRNTITNS